MSKKLLIPIVVAILIPCAACAQVFRVPSSESVSAGAEQESIASVQEQPQDKDDYIVYVAKWYDDLEKIAEQFGVDKEVLRVYNGMTSYKTSRRQKVLIPLHPEKVVMPAGGTAVEPGTSVTETGNEQDEVIFAPEETEPAADYSLKTLLTRKGAASDRIKVDVILPLNASGKLNGSSFDLYCGILLAVRDLAGVGIFADLNVIDKSSVPLTRELIGEPDIILGPVSPADLGEVLELCDSTTAVVSLLDHKAGSLAGGHPNFIQAPSPVAAQYADLIQWVKEDLRPGDKVFLLSEKGDSTALAAMLQDSGIEFAPIEYGILQTKKAESELLSLMTDSGVNRAIVASDKEAFVNDAVRNLTVMTYQEKNVVMYAPSRIRNFETIDIESLHNVKSHISCSYYVDYDSPRVKSFLPAYRALFGAEPTPYAYQGYDAAWYFLQAFYTPVLFRGTGLQSDFVISDNSDGSGHSNSAIRRVVYGDEFSVTVLQQ